MTTSSSDAADEFADLLFRALNKDTLSNQIARAIGGEPESSRYEHGGKDAPVVSQRAFDPTQGMGMDEPFMSPEEQAKQAFNRYIADQLGPIGLRKNPPGTFSI